MAKAPKVKNPEAVGFKEIFGTTALSTNNGIAAVFMSAMFMTFMTDYAGLGKLGATLATVLLLAARIIDAVDDPIQGFIMDSGKIGKHGKYKPFFLISIIMTTVGVIALYALPNGITSKAVAVSVWVIFFYLVYDIGASFYNQNLLFRTMTNDPGERSKLLIGPRLWVMVLGMFGSLMAAIAVSIQAATGSYKTAYMILALVAMAISFIISVIGWFMVKEKHVVEQDPEDNDAQLLQVHCHRLHLDLPLRRPCLLCEVRLRGGPEHRRSEHGVFRHALHDRLADDALPAPSGHHCRQPCPESFQAQLPEDAHL